jgi:hypothetical protein
MLGHLVQAHTADSRAEDSHALPRVTLLRWLNRVMAALLQRQAQPR